VSGEFWLAEVPGQVEGRHRKAARGRSSAKLDLKVSLWCSAPSRIPALAAIIRGHLILDLRLWVLELDSILDLVRATTHYIPLLSFACGQKYFQTLIQYSRYTQSPVEK